MTQYMKAATVDEIPPGTGKPVRLGDRAIAVFNVDGAFHAIDNTCTHDGGPLGEGTLDGHEVTCPWHGALFDVRTGEVLGPPAGTNVASYPVRVNGDDVEVEV